MDSMARRRRSGPTFSRTPANSPFETAGNGQYYLASDSGFQDQGTTSIPSGLLDDLHSRTTHAPQVLNSAIGTDTTLSPIAFGDFDPPDLGYHYDRLDYLMNNVSLSATLNLMNGVAIGLQTSLTLNSGAAINRVGPLVKTIVLTSSINVQEQPATDVTTLMTLGSGAGSSDFNFSMMDFSGGGGGSKVLLDVGTHPFHDLSFKDCRLHHVSLNIAPRSGSPTVHFVNNILDRCDIRLTHSSSVPLAASLYNNLFLGSPSADPNSPQPALTLTYDSGSSNPTWEVHDNLFDGAIQSKAGNMQTRIHPSKNAFTAGTANALGGSDYPNIVPSYQHGPAGDYYYPSSGGQYTLTSLINQGSRPALTAGLSHYTVKTALNDEDSGTVDIGFHYPASVDNAGDPIFDKDNDGMPDYWEDQYGLAWNIGTDIHGANGDPDADGVSNLQEYYNHSNPVRPDNMNSGGTSKQFSPQGLAAGKAYDVYYRPNAGYQWRRVYLGEKDQQSFTFANPKPNTDGDYIFLDSTDGSDNDGLSNGYEQWFTYGDNRDQRTSVDLQDSDFDELHDNWEVEYGIDPTVANGSDNPDGDYYFNGQENVPLSNLEEFNHRYDYNYFAYDPLKVYGASDNRAVVSFGETSSSPQCDQASFTIYRASANNDQPLTVYYSVGGSLQYRWWQWRRLHPDARPGCRRLAPHLFGQDSRWRRFRHSHSKCSACAGAQRTANADRGPDAVSSLA